MANWKIVKVIMLHKAGKPEDLVGSYRPLCLTSCFGKLLEKTVAEIGAQMISYLNSLKQLSFVSVRAIQLQEYFLMSRKPSTKFGLTVFSLS